MKDFSVTATAFSGYALLVKKPTTVFWWFVFSLAVTVISIAVMVAMVGPQMTALKAMREAGQMDPATTLAISRQLGPYQLFTLVFSLLTAAMTLGAANRLVLKPTETSFGSFRVGADEFRLLITSLVIGVLLGAAFVAVIITGAVIASAMGIMSGLRGAAAQGPLPFSLILRLTLIPLLGLIAPAFILVKFSLAPAQTVADGKIRIFESWSLTKGQFWKILGTLVLAFIPTLLVEGVILVIYFQLVASGPLTGNFMQVVNHLQPDVSSLGAAFAGPHIAAYVLLALSRTVGMAGTLVPAAMIYQATAADPAAVFGDDDDDDDGDYDDED